MANIFELLGRVLTEQILPEETAETAAKGVKSAAGKPKLPDWVLRGGPKPEATPMEPHLRPVAEPHMGPWPGAGEAPAAPEAAVPPAAPRVKVPMPPKQPFDPTTRVQQLDPVHAEQAAKLEVSPTYLDRLQKLGGGRRVTHDETWARAINSTPMTVEELAGWPARRKVNEVDVARAGLLRSELWEKYQDAIMRDDDVAAMDIERLLEQVEAGYNNLTATPGRATEFQKVFQANDAVQARVRQLRAANIPYSQVKDEINTLMKSVRDQYEKPDQELRTWLDRLESYATAAKLTSPVTHAINTISNSLTFAQRGLEKLSTAAILQAQGRLPEAEAMRTYAWGTRRGFISGAQKFLDALTTETPEAGSKIEVRPNTGKTLPMGLRVLSPFRWLEAADNFWKAVIVDSELSTHAFAQAKKEALQGPELANRVKWLMENPPEPWKESAWQTALEYTYQDDPGKLVNALARIQRVPGGKLLLPFIRTPANILRFQARRSPFGLLSAKNIADFKAGGIQRAEVMGRFGVGTGLMTAALALVAHGHVTGAYPSDPRERALWEAEGRKPWSILINGHWLSFDRVQPLGLYLSDVAALHEAMKNNDFDTEQKLGEKLAYQFLKGPLDVNFLQGMSALFDAIQDPEKNAKKFGQLLATGFVPNVLRDVRLQVDPTVRKPTTVAEAVENMLPGLSQEVVPRVTVTGENVEAEEDRLLRAFKQTAPVLENENTEFLRSIGWAPMPPRQSFTVQGIKKDIDKQHREAYLKEMGEVTLAAIQAVMKDPRIEPLDVPMKRRVTARVVEAARAPVEKKYQALLGLYGQEAQERAQAGGFEQ